MKSIDAWIIAALGLWQVGAGIAIVLGLVVGAQDAVQQTRWKAIRLFDTPAKVVWFVYAAAHGLAYVAFGGFSPHSSSAAK